MKQGANMDNNDNGFVEYHVPVQAVEVVTQEVLMLMVVVIVSLVRATSLRKTGII